MKIRIAAVLIVTAVGGGVPWLSGLPSSASDPPEVGNKIPTIEHVGPIAPNILGVEIQAGRMQPIRQVPYQKERGDRTEEQINQKTGEAHSVRLIRGGQAIGFLVGRERKTLSLFEKLVGEPLNERAADRAGTYLITSLEDRNYSGGLAPSAVWRKTKSNDWADSGPLYTSRHYLYLKLPHALEAGKRYSLKLGLNTDPASLDFVYNPDQMRSEAVHVTQIGFRPDDPGKSAFLSVWLGTGGPYSYPPDLSFRLRDETSGEFVYSGKVIRAWERTLPEQFGRKINNVKTDVYRMDFGDFRVPGKYRVCVEGVGCSYPFEIARDVWLKAFRISMKGHYHQRSGIELGPPYTDFIRPRTFHPANGVKVYQSTCPLMYSGNGINALGMETNNFDCLVSGRTEQIVPDAWGGYMDAGDWDRRIQHLDATRLHLELMDLFPDYFTPVALNIPETGNDLPDLIDEALFNLDCYRRLQTPAGGIRGGIESSEHPVSGETSWQESQTVMTYAPGVWESYIYAGVAARAGYVLRKVGSGKVNIYEESALRAMRWAEAEYAKWKAGPDYARATANAKASTDQERNLAAIELYRLTGDKAWHDLFLAAASLKSPDPDQWRGSLDAAFVYARLKPAMADPAIRSRAVEAILRNADAAVRFAEGNAFRITQLGSSPHPFGGFYTIPAQLSIVRAHALTSETAYLEAVVRSTQFSAGANPMNMTMTTGLGHEFPRHPLHEDSRHSGQAAPAGITVYGPMDLGAYKEFPLERLQKECTPPALEWPVAESYFDIYVWPAANEYTVMQTLGPAAYVWGYLAARTQ